MRLFRNALISAALLTAVAVPLARAVVPNVPSTSQYSEPSQIIATLNYVISTINAAITPQTMANFANPRNIIDNGQMQIQQRGTGTRTCGTTTIPSTAYAADRWGCNVNVTSGAGTLQVITSNLPAYPVFTAAQVFYRTSGALAQPQCVMQEVATSHITTMQGQNMVLSFYAQGLANMLAETTTLNAYVFTGTGTDEGLGTFTASPAITPAFTGISATLTQAFTITSSWARYTYSFNMPTTATEAAVALCWTPTTGGTAGTTDGFRFTGVQLEASASGLPSTYELRSYEQELATAQTRYYRFAEKAATYPVNGFCQATGANTNSCTLALPQPMAKIPTITITTAGTFKVNIAGTLTTIATPTAGNCDLTACIVTAANTNTAGQVEQLTGAAGGSGVWEVSGDF